jgi:hypothetical protein
MRPARARRHTPAVGDHSAVMEAIGELLAGSSRDLDAIERILTDGYAAALALEGEQWRLQKQLAAVASTLQFGDVERKSAELSELARRLELSDATLTRLRELLAILRGRYSELAAAGAGPHAVGR